MIRRLQSFIFLHPNASQTDAANQSAKTLREVQACPSQHGHIVKIKHLTP